MTLEKKTRQIIKIQENVKKFKFQRNNDFREIKKEIILVYTCV